MMYDNGRAERSYYDTPEDNEIPTEDCPECEGKENGCDECDHTGTVEMQLCFLCNAYFCRCDSDYERHAEK
jgi:hypothetical protein